MEIGGKIRRSRDETPCEWLIEPFRSRADFSFRRAFGCWSFYLGEKNVLLYVPAQDADGEGILLPTSPEHHASLIAEFPNLAPHYFLKKWLCLGANDSDFEETALRLAVLIARGDVRLGVPGNTRSRARARARRRSREALKNLSREAAAAEKSGVPAKKRSKNFKKIP